MAEYSIDAQRICARFFPTAGSSVRSHPPHATLRQYGNGMDELVAAGVVTKRAWNAHGSVEYQGTEQAVQVGAAERQNAFASLL